MMWAPCLYCPSASLALQDGECVPRERLAARGLLNCNLTEAISDITFECFVVSTSSNPTEVLSKEATVALSVVGVILFLFICLVFASFYFLRLQKKQIAEYRSQFFPVYTGKHQVKYHVNEVNLKVLHNNQCLLGYCNLFG